MAAELVKVEARLVGDVSGKVYAQNQMFVETIFKEPELYLGDCLLSLPMHPVDEGEPFPDLDPEDTKIKLQFRTNSANTVLGRSTKSPFDFIGHWRGWLETRPNAEIEIPSGGAV